MSDTQPKRFQCRHIHADGRRCGSPALRNPELNNPELCYYHHTSRKPAPHPRARRGRQATFDLPLNDGNDRTGLQLAIVDVLRRIAVNEVDPRRAGLLLYGLQIAATNLPQTRPAALPAKLKEPIEEIVIDETLGALAPPAEFGHDDPKIRSKNLTEQLLDALARSRYEEQTPTPCPTCKAVRQHNTPEPDSPSAPVESVPEATPEILASLEASAAGDHPGCPMHDGAIVMGRVQTWGPSATPASGHSLHATPLHLPSSLPHETHPHRSHPDRRRPRPLLLRPALDDHPLRRPRR